MSLELLFVIFVAIATLAFVLLLYSIFGRPVDENVKARIEQYLVETELASRHSYIPEDELETRNNFDETQRITNEDVETEWLLETRGATSGIQKILFTIGSVITPKAQAARISQKLLKAGIPLKANEFMAIKFLCGAVIFIISFFYYPIGSLFGAISGFILPDIYVSFKKAQRLKAFNDQILDTLVMLSNGLKAGYSLLQAMEMVARESPPPMSTELKRVLRENALGMNLEDALRALNERVESPDWDLVTTVILIQRQVGGNLSEILDKISYTIRQRIKIKGDIQTKTAQAKISGLLVGALPFFIALAIYIINPSFIMKIFTFKKGAFRGWYVIVAGLIWEAIGVYIIMKIVDIEV